MNTIKSFDKEQAKKLIMKTMDGIKNSKSILKKIRTKIKNLKQGAVY